MVGEGILGENEVGMRKNHCFGASWRKWPGVAIATPGHFKYFIFI